MAVSDFKTLKLYGVLVPAGDYERIKRVADALFRFSPSEIRPSKARKEAVYVAKQAILEYAEWCRQQ